MNEVPQKTVEQDIQDRYEAERIRKSGKTYSMLDCSDYTRMQEHLVYVDGEGKNGYHLDWVENKDRDISKDLAALKRHLAEYEAGVTRDKDSGAHPLAHVRARCGIIMDILSQDKDLMEIYG